MTKPYSTLRTLPYCKHMQAWIHVYEGFIHTPVACTSSRKSAGIPGTALFRPKIPSGEWTRAIITGGVGNKAGGEHIIGGGGIEAGGEHIIGRGGGIGSCSTHAHV